MNSYICCGMQYGDEAKGSFIDWLTHYINADCNIKYNGGSQALHTVITPNGIIHKFSQLGSGMFKEGCHTYITKDMVINPDNLIREMELLSEQNNETFNELSKRVHIHKNCWIVTPYHKLMNWLRELSLGDNRRGSVGTGVSEVPILREVKLGEYHKGIGMTVEDLYSEHISTLMGCLKDLQDYTKDFLEEHTTTIWDNCPDDLKQDLENMVDSLLYDRAYMRIASIYYDRYIRGKHKLNIYEFYENTIRLHDIAIWEGSQGLLLDKTYGISPNTTNLVTHNEPALDIAYLKDNIHKVGIAKAFCSRHGLGIFPTEDFELSTHIKDINQDIGYWNGSPRYGWFDTVLFRYANKVNKVTQIFLSSLDKLSNLDTIKVCTEYKYLGTIDNNFMSIFEYGSSNEDIIIYNIINNHPKLKDYLSQCEPIYAEYKSWGNITNVRCKEDLPVECIKYIADIEELIQLDISVISVGPTRAEKIILKDISSPAFN